MSAYINDNIKAGKYENKVPYISARIDKDGWTAHRAGESAAIQIFRDDLEDDCGTKEHPLADSLWRKAWEDGHSYGYHEVMSHYEELAEYFVKPFDATVDDLQAKLIAGKSMANLYHKMNLDNPSYAAILKAME